MITLISGRTVIVLVALAMPLVTPAFANGGKAKNAVYEASLQVDAGDVRFHVLVNPIIFYLGNVNRKYHALLIQAKNRSKQPLRLSKAQDTVKLRLSDGLVVKGLIDLRTADPQTWESLDAETRTAVAYPPTVKAGEEEGIYVFVPVEAVVVPRKKHEMPHRISFDIKSVPRPVELRAPVYAS